jgi:hypothetical protein
VEELNVARSRLDHNRTVGVGYEVGHQRGGGNIYRIQIHCLVEGEPAVSFEERHIKLIKLLETRPDRTFFEES